MTSTLIAIGIVVLLFVIYGLVRPSPGCMGHCNSCTGDSCQASKDESHV